MLVFQNFVLQGKNSMSGNSLPDCDVNIITLGCSKNTVDSEQLANQLLANQFKVVHDSQKHHPITIINTCGFVHDAKEESIETIFDCIAAKEEGKTKIIIVFGCLSQRYKDYLVAEMPEVDAFFGVRDLPKILAFLNAKIWDEKLSQRMLSTPKHYAYLKVSEGCNHGCSFCTIPKIRGKHLSKPIETIVEEAEILSKQGVKELILVAQDLTYYGMDIYKRRNLDKLLDRLLNVSGIDWIRMHYTYPNSFPMSVLDIMKDNDKICNYLDIPFQHINDDILLSMRRNITEKEILIFIDTIRNKIPDMALRTSLIVGYPGETKKIYRQLESFVASVQFDRMGVFTFSREEDTAAYTLKNTISEKEKQERRDNLMFLQQSISHKKNQQFVGKTLKVLIDSETETHYIGRTEYDSPEVDNTVLIDKQTGKYLIGNFYTLKINRSDDFDLFVE